MSNWIYIPGLATEEAQRLGGTMADRAESLGDEFIALTFGSLTNKQATGIMCKQWVHWAPFTRKALARLGKVQDNMRALKEGPVVTPRPAKITINEDRDVDPEKVRCIVAEFVAVPPVPNARAPELAQALEGIAKNDTLYLIGHGSPSGAVMGTYRKANRKCADPACTMDVVEHFELLNIDALALACLLEDEGLPKSHRNIELAMCFGAGYRDKSLQTVQPFAQRLAGVLFAHGYADIRVTGVVGIHDGRSLRVNSVPVRVTPQRATFWAPFGPTQPWEDSKVTFKGSKA